MEEEDDAVPQCQKLLKIMVQSFSIYRGDDSFSQRSPYLLQKTLTYGACAHAAVIHQLQMPSHTHATLFCSAQLSVDVP